MALPDRRFTWEPTRPGFTKWCPSTPTSAWWYDLDHLVGLIGAYLQDERTGGRTRTLRGLIGEFRGVSGSSKQRDVAAAAGLSGARLADLLIGDWFDRDGVDRLLVAMQQASRPVEPKLLGPLGADHLRARLVQDYFVAEGSFRYARAGTFLPDGRVPLLLEAAFGVVEHADDGGRVVVAGINWSASAARYPQSTFAGLDLLLARANVQPTDPVVLVVHAATPMARFGDRGKQRLALDLGAPLHEVVAKVTREWTTLKRSRVRADAATVRRAQDARPHARAISIKAACFEVMEQAYLKASAGGTLSVRPRQIMYAARPLVLKLTGGKFYAAGTQQFEQVALVGFMELHTDRTANWRIDWDARGSFHEPHGGGRVGLGTRAVDAYISGWTAPRVDGLDEQVAGLLRGLERVQTRGPAGRYGAVLLVEKEGFDALFQEVRLADRFDLAIMSTKGISVVAARALVDALSGAGVVTFVAHDFDKAGMTIASTIGTDSRRYRFTNTPLVVDLGVGLDDVRALGLEDSAEDVEYGAKKDPRLNLAESGATPEEQAFLVSGGRPGDWRGRRVELNAMTSDQLIAWLEGKLRQHGVGKVVPDDETLGAAYRRAVRLERMRAAIRAVVAAVDVEDVEAPADLEGRVADRIQGTAQTWDAAVAAIAEEDGEDEELDEDEAPTPG